MDVLTQLKNEASRTHAAWGEIRGRRAEREKSLQDLRHKAGEAARESEAFSLLPESHRPASDADQPTRIADLDAELVRLAQLETQAELAKNESAARKQVEVKRQFPVKIKAVQEANADMRRHLAAMGEAALEPYLQFVRARVLLVEADAALNELQAELGGDRRAKNRQQAEVRSLIDAGLADATDQEITGQSVVNMIDWTRLGSSPLEDFWTEQGLPTPPGSVMFGGPNVSDMLQLRDRRFRRRSA